jgi:hypothetical protein
MAIGEGLGDGVRSRCDRFVDPPTRRGRVEHLTVLRHEDDSWSRTEGFARVTAPRKSGSFPPQTNRICRP